MKNEAACGYEAHVVYEAACGHVGRFSRSENRSDFDTTSSVSPTGCHLPPLGKASQLKLATGGRIRAEKMINNSE